MTILSDVFELGTKNSGLYSELFYKYQDFPYKEKNNTAIDIDSSQAGILGYLPESILKPESTYHTKEALVMYRQGEGWNFVSTLT